MASFDYITETATKPARHWTNKDCLRFEYFNPNGVVARKRAVEEKISQLVDEGKAKTGALYAYGSLDNDYSYDKMQKMLGQKKVKRIDLYVAVSMMNDSINRAQKFIDSIE